MILANAAHINRILADTFERRDITAIFRTVENDYAGSFGQRLARLVGIERLLELDVDRLGMANENRHAHTGRRDPDRRVEDLLGLVDHLPLFLGRAVGHEDVDLRNYVERDLALELGGLRLLHLIDALRLSEELVHAFLACARYRLIGRHHHAADRHEIVQRLQGDHHLDGGAVRVGDDVPRRIAGERLGVDLRHHQRHVRLHPELRGVVDYDAAGFGSPWGVNGGDLRAGRKEPDVHAAEIELGEIPHLEGLVLAERYFLADRVLGGERHYIV